MAIATDSYYDVIYNEEVVDRIGLSKTLNNYTNEEIASMTFCGTEFSLIKNISQREVGVTLLGWDLAKPFDVDDGEHIGNGGKYILKPGISPYQYPNGMPLNVVWLAFEYGIAPPLHLNVHEGNANHCKIITEFDAPKYEYELTAPMQVGGIGAASWAVDDAPLYTTPLYNHDGHDNLLVYRINSSVTTGALSPNGGAVVPYMFTVVNDYFVLLLLCPYNNQWYSRGNGTGAPWIPDGAVTGGGGYINYDWETSFGASCNVATLAKLSFAGEAIAFPYTWYYSENYNGNDWGAPLECFGYNDLGEPIEVYFNGAPEDGYGSQRAVTLKTFCKNRDQIYKLIAGGGIKFKTDKVYKPIIQDGWVTGYTDDMTAESELDGWHGTTAHVVTPTPPSPTPPGPGPYDDDPWHGASFSGVGVGGAGAFAKVYYMTSTELANLRSWMNSINVPEGFDPMQQIIGLSQVPVALSGSGPENVVFVNSSAVYDPGVTTRAVDTGVATQQAMGTPISYYLGSVDIKRRMQERGEPYLDYDCQIELYLPLIGMFSLDTQAVMGRTISAYAVLDPVSGTLAAYAYVSKNGQNLPVAYGSTTIGVDLPISAQQLSVSRAALKQANAQLGASLLSGALTMLAAASSSGKSSGAGAKTSTGSSGLSAAGIREAGSDYMKASQVGNVFGDFMNWGRTIRQLSYGNNTAVAGSFGGSTAQWSYPFTPYVKIIRPRYEKPSNYAHSQGVPCVQTKTIGSCTGFIQCIGADVSGITGATDLELQAIQAALSNGIYAGGGS